jgi:hypothetical protein
MLVTPELLADLGLSYKNSKPKHEKNGSHPNKRGSRGSPSNPPPGPQPNLPESQALNHTPTLTAQPFAFLKSQNADTQAPVKVERPQRSEDERPLQALSAGTQSAQEGTGDTQHA